MRLCSLLSPSLGSTCITVKLVALGLASLLILLLGGCSKSTEPEVAPLPSVSVITVGTQKVGAYSETVARIEAVKTVQLKARVEGAITQWRFREGDSVIEGQLLFEIDRQNYEAAYKEAQANLSSAKTERQRTAQDYERGQELRPNGFISQSDLDTLASNAAKARSAVIAAEAAVQNAEANLSYTRIRAPFDGQISAVRYSVGNLVGPASEPLATLLQDDPIYANFQIDESSYTSFLQNRLPMTADDRHTIQPPEDLLTLTLILPNGTVHPYPGSINYAGIEVNATTGTVDVRAIFPNPTGLVRPGMYCLLHIESKSKTTQPILPQYAVQEGQQGKFVLVVDDDNTIRTRNIKVGRNIGPLWAVSAGLEAGDRLVVEGLQKVRSGTKVNPVVRYLNPVTGALQDTPFVAISAEATGLKADDPAADAADTAPSDTAPSAIAPSNTRQPANEPAPQAQ